VPLLTTPFGVKQYKAHASFRDDRIR
jgi:hypothetical protein